jgi:hypothetical protein
MKTALLGRNGAPRLWQEVELVGHSAEVWKGRCLDLVHHVAAMNLHRGLGNAHVAGNLLVEPSPHHLNKNCAFTWRQLSETRPERAQGGLMLAARAVPTESNVHGIEKILISERFR